MRGLSEGHVAVDAMVALMIVAMAVILSLRAVRQGERAALQAQEYRRADSLLGELMLEGPSSFEPASGVAGGFSWSVETQTTGGERPIAVCRRKVSLVNQASTRRYWASTLVTCPPEPAS